MTEVIENAAHWAEMETPCSDERLASILSDPLRTAVHLHRYATWFYSSDNTPEKIPSLDRVIARAKNLDQGTKDTMWWAITINDYQDEMQFDSYVSDWLEQQEALQP